MIVDLHVHEATYSPCSHMDLPEIVEAARQKGLDAVCITDHDSMGLRDAAHAYAKKVGFPIFVGVEIYTLDGDIVVFGLEDVPIGRPSAMELLRTVERCGGFCFAAHPFRDNHRGLEEKLDCLRGFAHCAGIEVLNGNTDAQSNQKALRRCQELGLPAVGSSDAHRPDCVGIYATSLPLTVSDERGLIKALRSGGCHPVFYSKMGYAALPID